MPGQSIGMDSDSLTYMEHVKKKKPRKFVMIVKGVDVLQLVIFKKGQFQTQLQKALKKGPKGPGRYWGVVLGEGIDVAFRMSLDDGFENDPCKVKTLKAYLKENTGTPFKPRFEFVTQAQLDADLKLSEVEDQSDVPTESAPSTGETDAAPGPEAAAEAVSVGEAPSSPAPAEPESESSEPADQVVENPPPQTAADSGAGVVDAAPAEDQPTDPLAEQQSIRDALQQQFDQLQPRMASAIAGHPDEADDLRDLASEFDGSLRINDLEVAGEWLEKLREALDELPETAPAEADAGRQQFEALLKIVAPVAVPLAKAGGEQGPVLADLLKTARQQREAGEFTGGLATLRQVEQILASGAPVAAASAPAGPASARESPAESDSPAPSDEGAQFKQRVQALMPRLKEAVAVGDDRGDQIKLLVGEAQSHAKQKQFGAAGLVLDRIESLLAGAGDPYRELYDGLLATIPADLQRLSGSQPDAVAAIQQTVDQGARFADQGDYQQAYARLNEASEAIARASAGAAAAEAQDVIPEGVVAAMQQALASARSRWDQAIADARSRLEPVKQQVADQFPESAVAIDKIIDSYWQDLLTSISRNEPVNDEAHVAQAHQSVMATVNDLREEVMRDELFVYLDRCGTRITPVFDGVFDDIETMLSS